jgi:hypothetical protein
VGESDQEAAQLVADLGRVARVVQELDGGPLQQAFGVRGFPAFALLSSGGAVAASGSDVAAISVSAQHA